MAQTIVHAGMPRTGTKSIQHSLMGLNDDEFLYAPLVQSAGYPNHSAVLRNLYTPPDDPRYRDIIQRLGEDGLAKRINASQLELEKAYNFAAGRKLLFSAEDITRMGASALKNMKSGLGSYSSDLQLIAYVRAPLSYIESALQQKIRQGTANLKDLGRLWPRYQSVFDRLDNAFDAENVVLAKYELDRFPNGDVVNDFCQRLAIRGSSVRRVRRNGTLARTAARLLHRYGLAARAGRAKPMDIAHANALAERLTTLDNVPFRLAPSLLEPLRLGRERDIDWMERRLGDSLAESLSREEPMIHSVRELEAHAQDDAERVATLIEEDGGKVYNAWLCDVPTLLMQLARLAIQRQNESLSPAARALQIRPAAERAAPRVPFVDMARKERHPLPPSPLTAGPPPLINAEKNLAVLWSPKSACTTVYVWFSHISGFGRDVKDYAPWPHRHRIEQYLRSELYYSSASSGMPNATILKIIRDPYSRAVSIYRHALQTDFADKAMMEWSSGRISAEGGYSFQTFLDLLETLDMVTADIHFRPQFHPLEAKHKPEHIINVSKDDLYIALNAFEEQQNWKRTDFNDLAWLSGLERRRKAKQEPIDGNALDQVRFSRREVMKLGRFPSYAQLLTERAKQRIERVYAADFLAYADHF